MRILFKVLILPQMEEWGKERIEDKNMFEN